MLSLVLFAAALAAASFSASARVDDDVRAVPTFEAAGLYWDAPGSKRDCGVAFRRAGEKEWHRGLDLWYDARADQCRGSLVHLAPGTAYEARLTAVGGAAKSVAFTTRAEQLPVARVVKVPAGHRTLSIREGGTAKGYVVYDGGGAVLDVEGAMPFDIEVAASYVVVRGFVLKGAQQDAIRIAPHATDVTIEDNDISGWGRPREKGEAVLGYDMDAGIRAVCLTCPEVARITIQRNRIHDPRHTANSWSDGHPLGPQAVAFSWCGGEHVIRHNEFGGGDKRFNDVVGGEDNFSRTGFPNADSDIYGNLVRDAWDDGIEAEGGNRNVRIWGNFIDTTSTGIATTITSVGPVYIFRNVYDRSRYRKGPPDADERQSFVKAGSDAKLGNGRRYVFHNTMLQSREPESRKTLGAQGGIVGTGADQLVHDTVSRNNIFHAWRDHGGMWDIGPDNDFAYDLYVGEVPRVAYAHAVTGEPRYVGERKGRGAVGRFDLERGSPGFDAGVRIPNFNDDFRGKAPDIGAQEAGAPLMLFGIAASRGPAVAGGFQLR